MQKQTGTHRSPRKAAFCGSLAGEARRSLAGVVAAGVEAYRRERHLPRLIGVSEEHLIDVSPNAPSARLSQGSPARCGQSAIAAGRAIGLTILTGT